MKSSLLLCKECALEEDVIEISTNHVLSVRGHTGDVFGQNLAR